MAERDLDIIDRADYTGNVGGRSGVIFNHESHESALISWMRVNP